MHLLCRVQPERFYTLLRTQRWRDRHLPYSLNTATSLHFITTYLQQPILPAQNEIVLPCGCRLWIMRLILRLLICVCHVSILSLELGTLDALPICCISGGCSFGGVRSLHGGVDTIRGAIPCKTEGGLRPPFPTSL